MKLPSWIISGLLCANVSGIAWAVEDAQQAIDEAEVALKKADSIGYEWRDSAQLLEDARAALAQGDQAQALKLAAQAKLQGERAYEQGMGQQNAGPHF